jgi:hypothetical protein
MAWKVRLPPVPFAYGRPSIHLERDDVHLSIDPGTIQVWIGPAEPGRLRLVVDQGGLRIAWERGYTQSDLQSATSVLRSLGIPKPDIADAFGPLHRRLHAVRRPRAAIRLIDSRRSS